jgi:ClpP class serine protease
MDIEQTTPALEWAMGQAWALAPEALEVGLRIAARQHLGPEAVEAREGTPLENTRSVTYRTDRGGKVAVVPVTGPIFRRANLFTRISGGTSTDVLARDFQAAVDDPSVTGVILDIDSPGGQVPGTAELAGLIRAARGSKPIVAYADGQMCSAAYWIGSAADAVVASPTADVGCIGVVTKARKREPPDRTPYVEFVSTNAENKRLDPQSDAGKAQITAEIDAIEAVFHEQVAAHRGVTVQKVRTGFGRGGTFVGQHAVKAGLADAVGSFEDTLQALGAGRADRLRPPPAPATAPNPEGDMTWQQKAVKALFGGSDEPAAEGADETVVPIPTATPTAGVVPRREREGDDTAALRAENQRLRAERDSTVLASAAAESTAYADRLVRDGKITAGGREAFAVVMAQHTAADHGIACTAAWDEREGSVVLTPADGPVRRPKFRDTVDTLFKAASANPMHESVIPDGFQVVSSEPAEPAARRGFDADALAAEDEAAAKRWADRQYGKRRNGSA